MVSRSIRSFWALAFVVFSAHSLAAGSDEPLDQLLDKSGLTEQVANIPESLKAGMMMAQGQGSPIPDSAFQAMLRSADRSIVADDILADIRESVAQALSDDQIETLLAWYSTPLGEEITLAENEAGRPEAQQEMMQQAKRLFGDARRVKFAEKLDKLFGATELVMNLQQHTGVAMFSAVMIANQPDMDIDMSLFNSQIEAQVEATRPAVEKSILLSLLYSYRNLEMDKLDAYEAFLTEPTTREFNGVVLESLNRSLEQGINDFAENLARLLSGNLQQS